MSSHHDNQGLLTTCFPGSTSSALSLALQGFLSPKLGQGLRATFPEKRVERVSVRRPLASSTLGMRRGKWSLDQEPGKVLLDLS